MPTFTTKMIWSKHGFYQGKGKPLLNIFPTTLIASNLANVTAPANILYDTVVDKVLFLNFSIEGKQKVWSSVLHLLIRATIIQEHLAIVYFRIRFAQSLLVYLKATN